MKPSKVELYLDKAHCGPETVPFWTPRVTPLSHKDFDTLDEAQEASEVTKHWVSQNTVWKCVNQTSTGKGCGSLSYVKDTILVISMKYVHPHGCTGGDYYVEGDLAIICPGCSKRNRLYNSPEVKALARESYKDVNKVYPKDSSF